MQKYVVVIASGSTEQVTLPHLTAHLRDDGIHVDVRFPPKHRDVTVQEAYKIIQSVRYDSPAPDKYVVLKDTDGKQPEEVLQPIRSGLVQRLGEDFESAVLCGYAQWHLEAWFFADPASLRTYLGRALGNVDDSQPDLIENPKEHLKNLLPGRIYTSGTSESIAKTLNTNTIAQRSPSFADFLALVSQRQQQLIRYHEVGTRRSGYGERMIKAIQVHMALTVIAANNTLYPITQ